MAALGRGTVAAWKEGDTSFVYGVGLQKSQVLTPVRRLWQTAMTYVCLVSH